MIPPFSGGIDVLCLIYYLIKHTFKYDLLQSSILSVTHIVYKSYSYILVLSQIDSNIHQEFLSEFCKKYLDITLTRMLSPIHLLTGWGAIKLDGWRWMDSR